MKRLDISHKLRCDYRTVKRFLAASEHFKVHADKGTMKKVLPDKYTRREHLLKCRTKQQPDICVSWCLLTPIKVKDPPEACSYALTFYLAIPDQ